MSIITLTTDWHKNDHYVGAIKGKIISKKNDVQIIDINHQIASFNTMEAAFVLGNCYYYYPSGSIHIIGVNSALNKKRGLLVFEKNNHFFICSDCGIPSLLFPEEELQIFKVNIENRINVLDSFDLFVDIAIDLTMNKKLEEIGTATADYIKQIPYLPVIDENEISGRVIYIDSFKNIITNINKEAFERVGKNNPFQIFIQSNHYTISKLNSTYMDTAPGDLLALFNSSGNLEIAINHGAAAELLNIELGGVIRIKFNRQKETLTLKGE